MSVRVNITISDKTKKYFEDWSKETGIPQSSLMSLAMSEYITQREAMDNLVPILEQLEKVGGLTELMKGQLPKQP